MMLAYDLFPLRPETAEILRMGCLGYQTWDSDSVPRFPEEQKLPHPRFEILKFL